MQVRQGACSYQDGSGCSVAPAIKLPGRSLLCCVLRAVPAPLQAPACKMYCRQPADALMLWLGLVSLHAALCWQDDCCEVWRSSNEGPNTQGGYW